MLYKCQSYILILSDNTAFINKNMKNHRDEKYKTNKKLSLLLSRYISLLGPPLQSTTDCVA